jgi:hypothetical protein
VAAHLEGHAAMPWPWLFCQPCYDPVASRHAGRAWFSWPFPQRDALANAFFLERMHLVWDAFDVLKRDPATYDGWEPDAQALYREYLEVMTEEADGGRL